MLSFWGCLTAPSSGIVDLVHDSRFMWSWKANLGLGKRPTSWAAPQSLNTPISVRYLAGPWCSLGICKLRLHFLYRRGNPASCWRVLSMASLSISAGYEHHFRCIHFYFMWQWFCLKVHMGTTCLPVGSEEGIKSARAGVTDSYEPWYES